MVTMIQVENEMVGKKDSVGYMDREEEILASH